MFEHVVEPLRLVVEHRSVGGAGGPTLRVHRASDGHELLRFDCFAEGAHWHLDPGGRDEITRLAPSVDALEWTIAEVRRDLAGYLERAAEPEELDVGPLAAALDAAEAALRNPPAALDSVEPAGRVQIRGEKWSLYPLDVLPLWVADMDFPLAEPIRRELQRAVDQGDVGYPMHPAPIDLPEIFARRTAERFAWEVAPRRVELLTDVMQGIYVALDRFTVPGDGVIVQTPVYPPFLKAVTEMDRELIECPLEPGPGGYVFDEDALRAAAVDARVLLLSHPHNPTGRVFRRDELERLAAIAEEHELLIVSDEIHGDLVYSPRTFLPMAAVSPEVEARTLTLTSATKAFNIAGLRCAVAVFGSAEMRSRFMEVPRKFRGGLGILGIECTRAAWLHAQPWLDEVRTYLQANRDLVAQTVAEEFPGVVHHPPESTYLAWLDCRALELEPAPYHFFLERAKVALTDGVHFGEPGRGFVRLNFATSRSVVTEALERLAKALQER